jgi:hypothetical protein
VLHVSHVKFISGLQILRVRYVIVPYAYPLKSIFTPASNLKFKIKC